MLIYMPVRFRRKRRFFRRKIRKGGRKVATVAKVKRLIKSNQESKYFVASGNTTADSSGSVIPLTNVTQGDTDSTRDGDKLKGTSLQIRYNVFLADTTNIFRVLLIRYKNMVSGDIAVADIVQTTGTYETVLSPYYHDNRKTFNVLYDRTHTLDTNNPIQSVVKTIKCNKTINYVGGASTVGSNRLWLVIISDSTAASHPGIKYYTKFNFTDS